MTGQTVSASNVRKSIWERHEHLLKQIHHIGTISQYLPKLQTIMICN